MQPNTNSREFLHLHHDRSIHACFADEDIAILMEKGWAEHHPFCERGVYEILVYALQDQEDIGVMNQVMVASYVYVSGTKLSNPPPI